MFPSGPPRSSKASIHPAGDQRQACRYEASELEAMIGWWEGEEFRSCPAHLVNVSQSGALVIAAVSPPQGSTVGLCLEGPTPTDWVEARLIDVNEGDRAGLTLRLAFAETCPYGFFKAAIASTPK